MLMVLKVKNFFLLWKYYFHNKKNFKKTSNGDSIVLVENNALCDSHIVYSYLSNILSQKYNSKIYSYNPNFFNNTFRKLIFYIKIFILFSYRYIYFSFGVEKNIIPKHNNKNEIEKKFNEVKNKLKSNKDIYDINLKDVNVGDLVYDGFLRKYDLPTINIHSKIFEEYLKNFIDLFYFWLDFFSNHKISSVIVSHTVYEFGIVLRLAIKNKIKAYSAGSFFIFSHDEKNNSIFDMPYFSEEFQKLDERTRIKSILQGKKFIDRKFAGEKTIENKVTALPGESPLKTKNFTDKVLRINKKNKILIAAHHFSDSPNAFGRNIFNDFYDWVDFLGKKSSNSEYDWYIKFHPLEYDANKDTVKFFLKKYPTLKLIDKNITHSQLISEKINVILTIYGTIGLEYAYFNIPVINAGSKNPHCSYNFNYHAKNIDDYNYAIDNFEKIKLNYDKKYIYEYFYMRYLHGFYLFPDELENDYGNIDYQSCLIYGKWMNIHNEKLNIKLRDHIKSFVDSSSFRCVKIK